MDQEVAFTPTQETYTDENIYKQELVEVKQFIVPEDLSNRYQFVFCKSLKYSTFFHSCRLEQAFEDSNLLWMVTGALKALSSSKKDMRVIVVDIASPSLLSGVDLVQSDSNNWHFNIHNNYSNEAIERVNPGKYTYFQNKKFFLALKLSSFYPTEDLIIYVYKKEA